MQDVTEQAKALGRIVAGHARTRAFLEADAAIHKDEQAKAVMTAFSTQAEHIQQLEISQQPIEPADKQKLAALQADMAGNELIKNFVRCQADYAELMNAVNQAMEEAINEAAKSIG